MTLDKQDLRQGMKFIVGLWQADYVVNAFSNDLAHIPAAEFKSDDGRDFSALTFEFFEDRTVAVSTGDRTESGTWEQTGLSEYHYSLGAFFGVPDGDFKKNAETLSVLDGHLVFSIGFLAIALKKVSDGVVTDEPDPVDAAACDESMTDIVGVYEVAKSFAFVGGEMGTYSKDEIMADLKKQNADEDEINDEMRAFDTRIEFCADHKVITWMKLPDGVSDEEIAAAVEAGEIGEVRDGYFSAGEKEWKAADGKYYYNSNEHRELFGEEQSPWDELKFDADGLMEFASGMMKLRRI